MSIIIKGMEMPKACTARDCFARTEVYEDGEVWCPVANGYIGDDRTVCPLVEIPPHGRLIDADAIRAYIDEKRPGRSYEDAWALTVIDAAPTIVQADDVMKRKKGEWRQMTDGACVCSVCQLGLESFTQAIFYSFCPFCGADMRKGGDT